MNLKKILSVAISVAMIFGTFAVPAMADEIDNWVDVADTEWYGDGTATSYEVDTPAELAGLAKLVNEGNDFSGKTVNLTASIDLEQIEWTPIGTSTNKFKGYFNGNGKTISNLYVSQAGDYSGLFGYILGSGMTASVTPTVANLVLADAEVYGNYRVGAVAGQSYTCKISDVTVTGYVYGTRYVGGISGHVYTYMDNCSYTGDVEGNFDAIGGLAGAGDGRIYNSKMIGDVTGSNWVGGIIANGQEGTSVVNCYVEGTIKTNNNYYWGVGGIAGVAGHGYSGARIQNNYFNGEVYIADEKVDTAIIGIVNADNTEAIKCDVTGNSWNTEYYPADMKVVITADVTSNTSAEEYAQSGKTENRNNNLVMLQSDVAYVDAESAENVIIMDGSTVTRADVENAIIANSAVAKIGQTPYKTLEAAFAAAAENDTITLLADITLDKGISVDGTVVLDLNGKTISGTDKNASGSFGLISIQPSGDLTINDIVGTGAITLKAETDRVWNAYSSVISNQRGKLTVNGGKIEHLGGTSMAYGIDNLTNGKGTYAETIVNGGTIKSTYRAIRQFLNGVEAQNILTVNGGTVEGANKSIWMQDPSKNANTGTLTVGENAVLNGDIYLFVTEGSTEWPVEVRIAASAVNGKVLSANVPAGYGIANNGGAYSVVSNTNSLVKDTITDDSITVSEGHYKSENRETEGIKWCTYTFIVSGEFNSVAVETVKDEKSLTQTKNQLANISGSAMFGVVATGVGSLDKINVTATNN